MGLDQTLYGSSRIGQEQIGEIIASSDLNLVNINTATQNIIGDKYFEMSNHLGNVLEVVSDRKLPVNDGNGNIDYFLADVVSFSDYYPYGMQMQGRNGSTGDYRYGFQGQEKDDEVKGEGNSVNYKYRMHDPRVGRFFAVDPLTKDYPQWGPYNFSGNQVIHMVELEGLEPSENPANADYDEKVAKTDVLVIGGQSNVNNSSDNLGANGRLEGSMNCGNITCGMYEKTVNGETYVSDTEGPSANDYNMFVNKNGTTQTVDESNASGFNNYESFVTNTLLQNFISGEGAENYVFPTNGIVSNTFLNSSILSDALMAFDASPEKTANQPFQYSFGGAALFRNLLVNEDSFNIPGFVGSGTITITPNAWGVYIEIFNITSLSSGAYSAKMPVSSANTPESYVRNSNETTPYGNISQTFSLLLPWVK